MRLALQLARPRLRDSCFPQSPRAATSTRGWQTMPPRCWLAVSGSGPAPFQTGAQVFGLRCCMASWWKRSQAPPSGEGPSCSHCRLFCYECSHLGFSAPGLSFFEIIRAPQFFKYWYLFPQLIWTPQEGASLGQAGHSAPRKAYSAEILLCALHGQALSPALLQGLAHGRTLLQPLFAPTPTRGHIAASSCPQDPLGEASIRWLSRNDRWTESA